MEQLAQVQQGNSETSLVVKVAILEERLKQTNQDVSELNAKVDNTVSEIKAMIEKLQNRPNSVQEFISENWKSIVLVVLAFMGANATVVESISRVMLGG
nr:MAG TPA: hemolysin [Caudoviricetes sp.]